MNVMNVNVLDAHDRLKHLVKDQSTNICQGAEDCFKRNPLSLALQHLSPYIYIFAHPRTHDDGLNKRMLWQPRLTKPIPQTNSYLFRATSNSDVMEVCWILPPRELWPQYEEGKVTQDDVAMWSIHQFQNSRQDLSHAHAEDLSEEKIKGIYTDIYAQMKRDKMFKNIYSTLKI